MTSAGLSPLAFEAAAQDGASPQPFAVNANVLLIEDELAIHHLIKDYFCEHGLTVTCVSSRAEASALLAAASFDLIVLDLCLGADSGLDILRDVRARSDIPVIITTGHGRDETDRVVGLELGADDYVVKPFGLRELLARARVVMRRSVAKMDGPVPAASSVLSLFHGWTLDRRRRHLTNPQGERIDLTKSEHALLLAFLDAPQRPLTREYLLQATRIHEDIYDRSIDVQILRLRRKLEVDPKTPRIIVTERGIGYVFAARVETLARAPHARGDDNAPATGVE